MSSGGADRHGGEVVRTPRRRRSGSPNGRFRVRSCDVQMQRIPGLRLGARAGEEPVVEVSAIHEVRRSYPACGAAHKVGVLRNSGESVTRGSIRPTRWDLPSGVQIGPPLPPHGRRSPIFGIEKRSTPVVECPRCAGRPCHTPLRDGRPFSLSSFRCGRGGESRARVSCRVRKGLLRKGRIA